MACGPSPHSTGHGLRPPAVFFFHRPNVWPAGTIDGRPATFFWSIAFLAGHYCASDFADIFMQLACTWLPSIHVYGGISLLASLSCKLTRLKLYKRRSLLPCSRVRQLSQHFQRVLIFRVRVHIPSISISLSLSLVYCVCFVLVLHTNTHHHTFSWS